MNHLIPGLFQGFVHGEKSQGCCCGAEKAGGVVADVQDQAVYIFWEKGAFCLVSSFSVFSGEIGRAHV